MLSVNAINTAICLFGAGVSVLMAICMVILIQSDSQYRRSYTSCLLMFSLNAVMLLNVSPCYWFDGMRTSFAWWVLHVCNAVDYMLLPLLFLLFSHYLLTRLKQDTVILHWRRFITGFYALFVVLMLVNLFTGWVYYFEDGYTYRRGPLFLLSQLPAMVIQFGNVAMLIHGRRSIPGVLHRVIYLYAGLPVLCILLVLFFTGAPIMEMTCTLMAMLLFCTMHQVTVMQLVQQQRELDKHESSIMAAQLRPHFMYNALSAIMCIEGNPPETVKAIAGFGHYLRGNLNSLRSDEVIPATQELQHVKAYIDLEQLRYDGKLQVDMDIQEIDFYLPPLSLEMLVENAIRHGFANMAEPGRITITSRKSEGWYLVSVEDNGVGFDPAPILNNPGKHVGLQSVRRRVEMLCRGQLVIRSTPGQGTRASILIPCEEAKETKTQKQRQVSRRIAAVRAGRGE